MGTSAVTDMQNSGDYVQMKEWLHSRQLQRPQREGSESERRSWSCRWRKGDRDAEKERGPPVPAGAGKGPGQTAPADCPRRQ